MYESYWQLQSRPFENCAEARFYYPSEVHQGALLKLRYAVENRRGADRAGGVGAVVVIVHGIARSGDSIDAEDIVDIPVGIVVDPIAWDLAWIPPHLSREVLVGIANAGIDHCDDDIRRSRGDVPGGHRADVGSCGSSLLPGRSAAGRA